MADESEIEHAERMRQRDKWEQLDRECNLPRELLHFAIAFLGSIGFVLIGFCLGIRLLMWWFT